VTLVGSCRFGAPLAAYFCRRNVLIGLSFWGLRLANGLLHTADH